MTGQDRVLAEAAFEHARGCLNAGDKLGGLHFLQSGLLLNPRHAAGWANRGFMLYDAGNYFEALLSFDRALAIAPVEAVVHNGRGSALQMLRRYDDALGCYDRAMALRPDSHQAMSNKAILITPTDAATATALFRDAVRLSPQPDYHLFLGMSLLREGRLKEGWAEYEWRVHGPGHVTGGREFAFPRWDGEQLGGGRSILLYPEQGHGDMIQFMRYAPIVRERFGGKVFLEVKPQLLRLAQRSMRGLGVTVVAFGDELPHIDCAMPMMSLPGPCGTDKLEDIPWSGPYLHADQMIKRERWLPRLSRLPNDRVTKVGLCWAGASREHMLEASEIDGRRSIALADLAPLAEVPGVVFVSLQKGQAALQAFEPPRGMIIGAWPDDMDDFADTAALIDCLDIVITVDTSVAHLAAAMGKPVWMLSRFDSCWRWMNDREDTPWYPTLRQFRQPTWNDWGAVIGRVARELPAWARQRLAA